MIKIAIDLENQADELIQSVISAMTGSEATTLNQIAGRAAMNEAKKYHREFDKDGKWENKKLPTHGAGRKKTGFGADMVRGWNVSGFDPEGATISNAAERYAFKVSGGTISAKRVKFLTIPLIPEAHGIRVSEYQRTFKTKLFFNPRKPALMEAFEKGKPRPVYALKKSVTMKPTKGALPDEDRLAKAFTNEWSATLTEQILDLA